MLEKRKFSDIFVIIVLFLLFSNNLLFAANNKENSDEESAEKIRVERLLNVIAKYKETNFSNDESEEELKKVGTERRGLSLRFNDDSRSSSLPSLLLLLSRVFFDSSTAVSCKDEEHKREIAELRTKFNLIIDEVQAGKLGLLGAFVQVERLSARLFKIFLKSNKGKINAVILCCFLVGYGLDKFCNNGLITTAFVNLLGRATRTVLKSAADVKSYITQGMSDFLAKKIFNKNNHEQEENEEDLQKETELELTELESGIF